MRSQRDMLTLAILCANAATSAAASTVLRRVHQHAVVGVGLDMLLQILRTLEGLAAEVTLMWLEGNVDSDVRGNVVALDGGGPARAPLAGQVEVVGALATDMAFADVVLRVLSDGWSRHGRICRATKVNLRRVPPHCRIAHRSLATGR